MSEFGCNAGSNLETDSQDAGTTRPLMMKSGLFVKVSVLQAKAFWAHHEVRCLLARQLSEPQRTL